MLGTASGTPAGTTDINGWSAWLPTANTTSGMYNVIATSAGIDCARRSTPTSALTNNAGVASSIIATSGGTQSTIKNTNFSAVVITVTDQYGNPVSGQELDSQRRRRLVAVHRLSPLPQAQPRRPTPVVMK